MSRGSLAAIVLVLDTRANTNLRLSDYLLPASDFALSIYENEDKNPSRVGRGLARLNAPPVVVLSYLILFEWRSTNRYLTTESHLLHRLLMPT